jgi:uncharacterized membrane protein (DUF485 family)
MSYALSDLPTARALLDDAPVAREPLPAAMLGEDPATYSYLLLVRFALVNVIGVALAASFFVAGWAGDLVFGDATWLTPLIVAVFVGGLVLSAIKVWRVSVELNAVRSGAVPPGSRAAAYLRATAGADAGARAIVASSLKLKLGSRIIVVRYIASSLVLLGLIGTVVGFLIALSGVDPDAAADASAIAPMVARLVEGMGVALGTTLVGAVLNIWLSVNYQILATGTANLIGAIVALGESHARA